jgi:asparagine synthetase B (glutamine-hydrolysing)
VPGKSPYTRVNQVEARHVVEIGPAGTNSTRYWNLEDTGDAEGSETELADRYRDLLLDAVKLRLGSTKGRVGFTLSGGMDSSSVLASAVRLTGARQYELGRAVDTGALRTDVEAAGDVINWPTVCPDQNPDVPRSCSA